MAHRSDRYLQKAERGNAGAFLPHAAIIVAMESRITAFRSAFVVAAMLAAGSALAQSWPTKPIRLITPYSPGGAGDWVARASTDRVTAALGQQFVIEPKPGAGGNIA